MIKIFFKLALIVLLVPMFTYANEHNQKSNADVKPVELLVYKTPTCGCCKKWISHIETNQIAFNLYTGNFYLKTICYLS